MTRVVAVILGFAGLWRSWRWQRRSFAAQCRRLAGASQRHAVVGRNPAQLCATVAGHRIAGLLLRGLRPCRRGAVLLIVASALSLPMAAVSNLAPVLPWIVILPSSSSCHPISWCSGPPSAWTPGRVGILLMTEVLVGSISAGLLAGEDYGASEAIGTALIVTAGLVEVWGRRS